MKKRYWLAIVLGSIMGSGFLVPEPRIIPVQGANAADWNKDTFWYEPWGTSGVHKGIDVFAQKGAAVVASSHLIVLYRGSLSKGGKVIVGLGPKWRIHYFAHLEGISGDAGILLGAGDKIGTVGDSGNAKGKQPHLHYSIVSLIPRPWAMDSTTQGYKKAFFINPIDYLADSQKG